MSDRGTLRGRWIEEIFRTPLISAEVKVLMLALAHYGMNDAGRVSVPRVDLAARCRCHPRKITEKIKSAIDAGLLRQVERGQKHRTAVYVAVIPGISQGADNRPPENSQGADSRPPETDSQGAKKRPPENSQGADSRPPNMYRGVDVGDEVENVAPEGPYVDGSAAPRRATQPSKPKRSRRKPETPIPDIFPITAEMRAWASSHSRNITVDLDDQTERFINHARQRDRRCRDWVAAWRNWILKAQDFADNDRQKSATGTDGAHRRTSWANPNYDTKEYLSGW
jgi:hypothetical protein